MGTRTKLWGVAATGALVTAAANRGIRRGVSQLYHAVDGVVRNPVMEWVDPETGQVAETEHMDRRTRWQITRPLWFYTLGARKLPCGCTRRFRITLYAADCAKHSDFGRYRLGRKEFLERADWDDVQAATDRLAAGTGSPDAAAFTDLLHDHGDREEVKALTAALVRWLASTESEDDDDQG